MMKERTPLFFNVIVSFAAFLLCFGKACYEYGLNAGHTKGLGTIILFPLIYFALLVTALVIFHRECYSAKPYIVMVIVSIAFIVLAWGVFFIAEAVATESTSELWFPIVLTMLSALMSVLYCMMAYQFHRKPGEKLISSKVE